MYQATKNTEHTVPLCGELEKSKNASQSFSLI